MTRDEFLDIRVGQRVKYNSLKGWTEMTILDLYDVNGEHYVYGRTDDGMLGASIGESHCYLFDKVK